MKLQCQEFRWQEKDKEEEVDAIIPGFKTVSHDILKSKQGRQGGKY